MRADREEYIAPVGFAREPAAEARRWVGRVLLGLLVLLLAYVVWNSVINPRDEQRPIPAQTTLPDPI